MTTSPIDGSAEDATTPKRVTKHDAAKIIGRSEATIDRMVRDGKLKPLTPPGKKQWFDFEECRQLAASLRADEADSRRALAPVAQEQVAKAHAVTDAISAATGHADEAHRFAMSTMQTFGGDAKVLLQGHVQLHAATMNENIRMASRIEKLEKERDDVWQALEAMRELDEERSRRRIDEDRKAKQSAMMLDAARLVIPGLLARLVGGSEKLHKTGFERIFGSLSPEQKVQLASVLNVDQLSALALLFPDTETTSQPAEPTTASPVAEAPALHGDQPTAKDKPS